MYMTPPPVAPHLLRRSSSDRIFGGVCGGLGRYWNVDPVILRVVFGVSLLLGGLGLFAYLALWMLVPDEAAPPTARITPAWGLRVLGFFTAAIAGLIGLALLFNDSGGGGILLGALIASIVVWIVLSQRSPQRPAEPAPTGYAYGGTGDYPTTAFEQPPLPPRERSYLGLMGLCAAVAATGLAMLLSGSATTILAAGLIVLGATLLIGAFRGRARWLLLFAVPLLLVLSIVGQVQRIDRVVGEVTWQPSPGQSAYSLDLGTADLEFTNWDAAPEPADRITAEIGAGQLNVTVPRNWDLLLNTDFGAASVVVDGRQVPSVSVNGTDRVLVPAKTPTADGTLRMDVSVRLGEIRITTGAPAIGAPITKEKAA